MTEKTIKNLLAEYQKRTADLISEGQNFKEDTARAYMKAKKNLKGYDEAEKVIKDNEKSIIEACGNSYGCVFFETTPRPDDEFNEWFIIDVITGDIEYGGHTCVYQDYGYYPDWGMSGSECPLCGDIKFNYDDAAM